MDPTLTRSAAHKLFGDLYRKERPPELQEKVDKIVSSVSDIYVRIKRIEELDKEHQKSRSLRDGPEDPKRDKKRQPQPKKNNKPQDRPKESGIISRVLGGELAAWGKKTQTIDTGFLAINVKLSDRVADVFRALPEDQIIALIKAFRIFVRVAWEEWEPARYNTVLMCYQFFNEFINVPPLFRKEATPEEFVNATVKMQKFYLTFINHPDYRKILTDDFVQFLGKLKEAPISIPEVRMALNYICTLEQRAPTLKNIIIAFYSLVEKDLVSFEHIATSLKLTKPVLTRYRAPEAVLHMIATKQRRFSDEINRKQLELQEIDDIRKRFFHMDTTGKVKMDFINGVCEDVIRRSFSEKLVNENLVKQHKNQPYRLLWVALRDFDLTFLPLLNSSVTTNIEGKHEEVILFKQGIFNQNIEELQNLLREIESFMKKNPTFEYSFKEMLEDIIRPSSDPVAVAFLQIVRKANAWFRKIAFDLKVIMDNHRSTSSMDSASQEKFSRTRILPIESVQPGARFFPYADRELSSSNRLNGKRIEAAMNDLLMNVYNFLYIFRDPELLRILSSEVKFQAEINKIKSELDRLGDPL